MHQPVVNTAAHKGTDQEAHDVATEYVVKHWGLEATPRNLLYQKLLMTIHRVLFLGARLYFGLLILLTSIYCLLAYIPFTYYWVIKCTLVSWLPVFMKFHPYLYWAALIIVIPTIAADIRRSNTQRLTVGFIIFHVAAGMALLFHPLLPNLANDDQSFIWSLIWLFPLLWIGLIDYVGHAEDRNRTGKEKTYRVKFSIVLLSAVFSSLLYSAVFYLRYGTNRDVYFEAPELFVAICWSVVSHILLFTVLFAALNLVYTISVLSSTPAKVEFLLRNLLASACGMLIIRNLILPALSFSGYLADVFALVMASSIVAFVGGLSSSLRQADNVEVSSEPLFSWLMLGRATARSAYAFGFTTLIGLAYLLPVSVAMMDWDFLLQKLLVLVCWTAAFAFMKARSSDGVKKQYSVVALLLIMISSLSAYKILTLSQSRLPQLLNNERLDVSATLERYAEYDVSFRVARELLSSSFDYSLHLLKRQAHNLPSASVNTVNQLSTNNDNSLYTFLQQNTNLLPSAHVPPVEVKLVDKLIRTDSEKPNIFIFVIDSLRPDYLSPYNKQVTFTPNIESFARESVVLKNAFTRYGGTVLSEPAIWTGGMQLHKQYIEPFYPMNALQKLIEFEDYETYISIDPVLQVILRPSPSIIELDKSISADKWLESDFCRTLREVKIKLDERQETSRPVFVYIQPQNIHLMKLYWERKTRSVTEEFPNFEAHYAAQIKRMDEGFGEFIRYLKERGHFDNSIVVLTADHGDALGEEGRWGHSSWIFPEILRIPMIIHLPPRLQKGLVWNPTNIAFSTDITPSLYYLLGHKPIVRNEVFGRPLFTTTQKEQTDYLQKSYLVVSSYGPTYGILGDNGRWLFIADAKNRRDYFYNLVNDPKGSRNLVTDAVRAKNEKLIRGHVLSINRFYNFHQIN